MFEQFPRFLQTSETSKDPSRLNVRHAALIESNKELLSGARVLDLASHDGRWSFFALQAGASHVTGIEWKERLVTKSRANFEAYDVPKDSYRFIQGDIFTEVDAVTEPIDVIFCFGIFYHINNHMLLLEKLSRTAAKHLILDTNVARGKEPVIRLQPEPTGTTIVGHPTVAAVELMLQQHGWSSELFDWKGSGLLEGLGPSFYRSGKRVTVLASRD